VKHNLGKVWILVFLVWLQAEDFSYHITASTQEVYLHEPLQLTMDIEQTNPKAVLLFQFEINKSSEYHFKPLFIKNESAPHESSQHAIYEIYPLKEGNISISFTLVKRVTTDDKVRYFASGDRDDFKKLETIDYPIHVPKVHLQVKPLPKGTQLVGNFTLQYTLQKHKATAYEALPLQMTLKGKGYIPLLDNIIPKSDNFTLFTEKPLVKQHSSLKGTEHTILYSMALSAQHSFTLPAVYIQSFNPKTHTSYVLSLPKQEFNISSAKTHTLVDTVNIPPLLQADFSWIKDIFSYLLIFISGFLTAWIIKKTKTKQQNEEHPLIEKINHTKDKKALLQLLMATDSKKFSTCIQKLENTLYKNDKMNISKVKKEAIDLI
jgi:hypothetical protein